jgi:hypothetical protein
MNVTFTKFRYGPVLWGNPIVLEIEMNGQFFIQLVNDSVRHDIPDEYLPILEDLELSGEWFPIEKLPEWISAAIKDRLLRI